MPPPRLLVVTTRSRLRGVRFLPGMLLATRRIRGQLAVTDGVVRWASVITGPTEFWTITVWRSRHAMQEFMRSGEHGRIMWQVGRWLASFWLLRSRLGHGELGAWDGAVLRDGATGEDDGPDPASAHTGPTGDIGAPLREEVLAGVPGLLAAIGPDGAAHYDSSPTVQRDRARLQGTSGLLVRVAGRPAGALPALLALRRLARRLRADPAVLRAVIGVGRTGEVCLLALWREPDGADRLLASEELDAAGARWGDRLWAGVWLPESEFGTWDGLRLRTLRRPDPAHDLQH